MHGDAIVGLPGELVQGSGGAAVYQDLLAAKVLHQRGYGALLAKGHAVVTPVAAAGDGFGEVATEEVILL